MFSRPYSRFTLIGHFLIKKGMWELTGNIGMAQSRLHILSQTSLLTITQQYSTVRYGTTVYCTATERLIYCQQLSSRDTRWDFWQHQIVERNLCIRRVNLGWIVWLKKYKILLLSGGECSWEEKRVQGCGSVCSIVWNCDYLLGSGFIKTIENGMFFLHNKEQVDIMIRRSYLQIGENIAIQLRPSIRAMVESY